MIAIGFLDLSLSLDNVVAVVAMSQNLAVIVIGVMASIAMLAVAAQLVRKVMGRYKSLEPAAYIILAFLGVNMILNHGSEFLVWTGEKLTAYHDIIAKVRIDIGDIGEIAGVIAIIAMAITMEEVKKRRKKHHHHNAKVTAPDAPAVEPVE